MSNSLRQVVIERTPKTKHQLITCLIKDKPKEIFNIQYSHKTPLYTDVECFEKDIRYRCLALADKSLHTRTYDQFYDEVRISGIENLAYYI